MARPVPAITIQAMLAGFEVLGLDERALRADAQVPELLRDRRAVLPGALRQRLWDSAYRAAQRDELAIQTGLALPYGALGPMDYLANSADTVGASCEALSRHFSSVSSERSLEIEQRPGDYRVKLVVSDMSDTTQDSLSADELALSATVGRFRARVDGFTLAAVQLRRAAPRDPERFAELFGAPVFFGHAVAALCLPGRMRDLPMSSRDPWLRQVLLPLFPAAELGGAEWFERSMRSCLRELLPQGRLIVARVARSLGMSERSLHRRLRGLGQSYQVTVDVFRREEAERLLLEGRVDMGEISHRLGFADQSAFSRAFKRWTGLAPRAWLACRNSPNDLGSAALLADADK
jgi:AraC-like DNA-binding protein